MPRRIFGDHWGVKGPGFSVSKQGVMIQVVSFEDGVHVSNLKQQTPEHEEDMNELLPEVRSSDMHVTDSLLCSWLGGNRLTNLYE